LVDPLALKLRELIDRYGNDVADDPRRSRALLNDTFPQNPREVSLLTAAVEERVAQDLRLRNGDLPFDALRAQLEQRLVNNRAISADGARWAVNTWATALGVRRTAPAASPSADSTLPGSVARQPVPPPPALRQQRPWRTLWIAMPALIVAGVIVALLNGWIRWPETPATSASPEQPTAEPAGSLTKADAMTWVDLDPAVEAACDEIRPSDTDRWPPEAAVVIECPLDDHLRGYALYNDRSSATAKFEQIAGSFPLDLDYSRCPSNPPGRRTWNFEPDDADTVVRGDYACYLDGAGPRVVFIANFAPILGWLEPSPGDPTPVVDPLAELVYYWLNDHGIRRP